MYLFIIPSSNTSADKSLRQRAATFDSVGAVLIVIAFTVLIIGISFGGEIFAWHSGSTIALFVVAGVLWAGFSLQQALSIFTSPGICMFPVHLLMNVEAVLLFIICAAVGAVAYVTAYYVPLYFQFTRGDSAIMTAVRLLPFILLLITTIPTSGFFMSRIGYYKP